MDKDTSVSNDETIQEEPRELDIKQTPKTGGAPADIHSEDIVPSN